MFSLCLRAFKTTDAIGIDDWPIISNRFYLFFLVIIITSAFRNFTTSHSDWLYYCPKHRPKRFSPETFLFIKLFILFRIFQATSIWFISKATMSSFSISEVVFTNGCKNQILRRNFGSSLVNMVCYFIF